MTSSLQRRCGDPLILPGFLRLLVRPVFPLLIGSDNWDERERLGKVVSDNQLAAQ
jgi:hypothetical protein